VTSENNSGNAAEPQTADLAFLRLLHLADSALPIGAVPHSFGLETLVDAGLLTPPLLPSFLEAYLLEAGVLETVFCRAGFRSAMDDAFSVTRWTQLNDRLGALKPARESRAASAALGSRFLALVLGIVDSRIVLDALEGARQARSVVHHSLAFGLTGAVLTMDEESVVLAFLHQSIMGLVSACQRLMPIGQSDVTRIIWNSKPSILDTVRRSRDFTPDDVPCFLPVLDWGAMEHAALSTRLFIS
jgi:urease accessory protein